MSQSSAHSKAKYRVNHREAIRERAVLKYKEMPEQHAEWYATNRRRILDMHSLRLATLKLETLTHYGKGGVLQCCGDECSVVDIDMLTLDHVENDGALHRKSGFPSGSKGFPRLQKAGYPAGYQTLCWNHQWKKELVRLRQRRLIKEN